MKLPVLQSCRQCGFRGHTAVGSICMHPDVPEPCLGKWKRIPDTENIPDWCPLMVEII